MYILENKETGAIFGAKSYSVKSQFKTVASAKAAATRYEKEFTPNPSGRIVFTKDAYKVTDYSDYVEPNVEITFTNLHDGSGPHTTTIGLNDVGTCVDPRRETYWAM
jgi:hypothetical protein